MSTMRHFDAVWTAERVPLACRVYDWANDTGYQKQSGGQFDGVLCFGVPAAAAYGEVGAGAQLAKQVASGIRRSFVEQMQKTEPALEKLKGVLGADGDWKLVPLAKDGNVVAAIILFLLSYSINPIIPLNKTL